MALVLGGRLDEARAAYAGSPRTQAADGSWATSWRGTEVLDADVDTNQVAYVAVGAWQWLLVTGDRSLPVALWPVVRRALDLVVSLQQPGGQIAWCRRGDGSVDPDALVTGSSSTYQALRCGIALAELVGEPQPSWEVAAGLLQHAVAAHPEAFLDKRRFSMDWYYPVLAGAVRGPAGRARLARDWSASTSPASGCAAWRTGPWVTGAETAELALALAATGERERGLALLAEVQHLREHDGSYWTGLVFDEDVRWPVERSSWTRPAMVLAADALAGGTTLALFRGDALPTGVLLPADACAARTPSARRPASWQSPTRPRRAAGRTSSAARRSPQTGAHAHLVEPPSATPSATARAWSSTATTCSTPTRP
jgi:hypothetical protein